MSKRPKQRKTLTGSFAGLDRALGGDNLPEADSGSTDETANPSAKAKESAITGLREIKRYIDSRLEEKGNTHLFLHDTKIFPETFTHGKHIVGITGQYEDTMNEEIDLSIGRTALETATNKFTGQLRRDFKPAAIQQYYGRFREYDWWEDYHHDERPVVYYPPNALALLLFGITEASSISGVHPDIEKRYKNEITGTIAKAASFYAWGVYVDCCKQNRPEELRRLSSDSDIEIERPKKEPEIITGLDKIERFIQQRLINTGNRRFIGKASLSVLKCAKTIQAEEASALHSTSGTPATPKTIDSSGALIPMEPRSLVPSKNGTIELNWSINKNTLEALTDRFVAQLKTDVKDNEGLFTPDKMFSPNALSVLLYGLEFARRETNPPYSFAHDILNMAMGSVIGSAIEEEAKHYAECIYYEKTAEEVSSQMKSPRRR